MLQQYHESLVLAEVRLLEAYPEASALLVPLIQGLFSQWPERFNTNTPKEVLFLHEIDTLLSLASSTDFHALLPARTKRLARSVAHDTCLPMQRALELFRNLKLLELFLFAIFNCLCHCLGS